MIDNYKSHETKSNLGVGSDAMSGPKVNPKTELWFCIIIDHRYINGGRDPWASSPSVS